MKNDRILYKKEIGIEFKKQRVYIQIMGLEFMSSNEDIVSNVDIQIA